MSQRIIDHEKAEILRLTRELVGAVRYFSSTDSAQTNEQKLASAIADRLEVIDRITAARRRAKWTAAAKKRAKTKRRKMRAERAREQ